LKLSEEEKQERQEEGVAEEEILTVKDLCKIARTDITSEKQKQLLHESVCFSMSTVLRRKKWSEQLKSSTKTKSINNQLVEILKNSSFRQEFVEKLTLQLT